VKTIEITYRHGDPAAVPPRARPADAEAARRRMDEGSRACAELFAHLDADDGLTRRVVAVDPRDLGLLPGSAGAPSQRPYAAVLGCADARVPVELIFNEGPNDLFVVRVAGNPLGEDVRGSLKYALEHLGDSLKRVVVLGHSGCGAVGAAVDVFLDPAGYLGLAAQHAVRAPVAAQQFVYPDKSQSPEQQKKDEAACYTWAVEQTKYDPAKPPPASRRSSNSGRATRSSRRRSTRRARLVSKARVTRSSRFRPRQSSPSKPIAKERTRWQKNTRQKIRASPRAQTRTQRRPRSKAARPWYARCPTRTTSAS
jgi:hypothetical protein